MTTPPTRSKFAFPSAAEAIAAMLERVAPVGSEQVALGAAMGRVLGQAISADRPSPACDVSAMDGYAVRLEHLGERSLAVTGEVAIGEPPPAMPADGVLRIFTGGPVPEGCAAVIPREQVIETADAIELPKELQVTPGQHIRRRGENIQAGETVLAAGRPITPAVAAALAAFGIGYPRVHRPVRLAAIVTGNEVLDPTAAVRPWQLRDSNGATLEAMFARRDWIDWQGVTRAADHRASLRDAVAGQLADNDAVLLTGGVSMGDYDFVPTVLAELGCEIVFHKLPIRPGKPVLGSIGPRGQTIFGLPGNPVSVMTTARRIATPLLRRVAGHAVADSPPPMVLLTNPHERRLALDWSLPVRLVAPGQAELIASRGSGDLVSTASSDGFVEVPADHGGGGPWPFYRWSDADE